VALYQAALDAGGGAGRFAPSSVAPDLAQSDWRRRILAQWRSVGADLVAGLGRWSEPALDRHLLPHPLLGKLTVREMLFFTLYHNVHHGRRVAEPTRR
jgi:hypothetical protein